MKLTTKQVKEIFAELKTEHLRHMPVWQDIEKYAGITLNAQQLHQANYDKKGSNLDKDIEDPTAALSIFQSGDYMYGIIWGSGIGALQLKPSEFVKQRMDVSQTKEYYDFRTRQLLTNINCQEAGFANALKPALYELNGFGTAGIGSFVNPCYPKQEENPFFFRNFGIGNCVIDEGKNGSVEVIHVVHQWRVNQIVDEFSKILDINKLPEPITKAYNAGKVNEVFTLVQAIFPNDNFILGKKGKLGARYKAIWFLDGTSTDEESFYEEYFRRKPIGIGRGIKISSEVYGRAAGTILINSIKVVNYGLSQGIENIEKLNDPAMGVFNNALFGDSVLDTSAGSVMTFNSEMMGGNKNPFFRLNDVGDPTAMLQFLIPYLNEKITSGFKIDVLLDFNDSTSRTATEMMQRSVIRGKSIAGMLTQSKTEILDVAIDRAIQIEDDLGLAGIRMNEKAKVAKAKKANLSEMIIPEAVQEAMDLGIRWYEVSYNNELERMVSTDVIERIIQAVNGLHMIASMYPEVLQAVEWFKLWKDVNEHLGINYIKDEDEFKVIIEANAQQQQQALMLQAGQVGADILEKNARAKKTESEVSNAGA